MGQTVKDQLRLVSVFVTLLFFSFIPLSASAEGLRLGFKVGAFDLDFDQYNEEENFLSTAVQIGYEFANTQSLAFTAEAEFSSSITEGKVGTEDFSYRSIGILGAVRSKGNIYFIGRLGVVDAEADLKDSPTIEDDGTVYGAGIGFGQGDTRREITLDAISYQDDHSAIYLAFGLTF